MKRTFVLILIGILCSAGSVIAAEGKIFGPVKYVVKERYGKSNRYGETVKVPSAGGYIIKLQNGETAAERSDLLAFSVNRQSFLPEGTYNYRYMVCFVTLKTDSTSTFELSIRDFTPTGLKRPPATPRNATLEVLSAPVKLSDVALGLNTWEDLNEYTSLILKIKSPETLTLALSAADLRNDASSRAGAMRQLADRKEPAAQAFILHEFNDAMDSPKVRAEAAIALGLLKDKAMIPTLIQGVLDPDELIRTGSARALSFYREEDTEQPLSKALKALDSFMRSAVVQTIVDSGWKPMGLLMELAESADPAVANMGVELLGGSRDKRAVDMLLKYLDNPGKRDVGVVIHALGESKDTRAVEPLTRLAQDPAKRRGKEAELGTALAALGDPKSADIIAVMIKKADTQQTYRKLTEAYKKLTGMDYKK